MITPKEIHDYKFKKSFRGYNEVEVDDFLDRVAADLSQLLTEKENLNQQLSNAKKELEKYSTLEKTLNETLEVAQRTADELLKTSRQNSDEMKKNAEYEFKNILDKAQIDAKQLIDNAIIKRNAAFAEYEKFVNDKKNFIIKWRTMLEKEIQLTNQLLDDTIKIFLNNEDVESDAPENSIQENFEPSSEEVSEETRLYKTCQFSRGEN